jgi:hypothetical protein
MITLITTNTDYTDKQHAARMITQMKGRDYTDNSQKRHQDLRMKGQIKYTIAANFKKNAGF